ncbi:MAG TPA: hypothetical protein VF503_18005 [Sphingobium sp.]
MGVSPLLDAGQDIAMWRPVAATGDGVLHSFKENTAGIGMWSR